MCFPFLQTRACCEACANLKAAFLVAVVCFRRHCSWTGYNCICIITSLHASMVRSQVFLGLSTVVTMIFAKEVPLDPAEAAKQSDGEPSGPFAVFSGIKNLAPGMPQVLLVTGLTWLSWFPFMLFDTDWMGCEMYHGRPDGDPTEVANFQEGVRQGAFGLLLNSVGHYHRYLFYPCFCTYDQLIYRGVLECQGGPRDQLLPYRAHVPEAHRHGRLGHQLRHGLHSHGPGHHPQRLVAGRHRRLSAGRRHRERAQGRRSRALRLPRLPIRAE
jgi:hypothetical protein